MPFGNYRSLADALVALQVTEIEEAFLEPKPVPVSDTFRSELDFLLRHFDATGSEAAICESLLFPVLWESLKPFVDVLSLWSHTSLYRGAQLLGAPDYFIAKRSPLSLRVPEPPYALIMEAKKNDFDAGWSQCLAAMHAVQSLNGEPQRVIYGSVSDGLIWRFGKLHNRTLAHHPRAFQIPDLDELFAAWHHVMELCKQQVLSPAAAA
jgi:hypothetical protein